jgi:hypothetical protein
MEAGYATPVVDDPPATVHKIEMATDDNGGVGLSGQSANYISGTLIDRLLLNRTPNFGEKIANGGLTLP